MILDIWDKILYYMDEIEDICNCRLVCKDFKDLIERKDEIKATKIKTNISFSFLCLFPRLKRCNIPTKISNIYLLKHLSCITFHAKHAEIMQYMSSIEDLLFPFSPHYIHEKKYIKIYTEKGIYWLSQYKYGRNAEHDHDDIDDYFRDATRCRKLVSNKKPFAYFPIKEFLYVCPVEQLSGFDYYPSSILRKYTWQPTLGKREEISYFQYLEYLADSVLEVDPNETMETYEIPILEKDLPVLKSALPNLKKWTILKQDSLVYSNRIIHFNDLPHTEDFIDNIFKF